LLSGESNAAEGNFVSCSIVIEGLIFPQGISIPAHIPPKLLPNGYVAFLVWKPLNYLSLPFL